MLTVYGRQLPKIPASHENPQAPGVWKQVLFQREALQPGQVQMVNWSTLPAGKSFAPHYHQDMQEIFIIVAGQAQMTVDGHTVVLQVGDAALVEPKEVHEMHNRGDEDVQYVVFGVSSGEGGRTIVVDSQQAEDRS